MEQIKGVNQLIVENLFGPEAWTGKTPDDQYLDLIEKVDDLKPSFGKPLSGETLIFHPDYLQELNNWIIKK